jgi:glyoxylase-like metal-dependent hydrolase (beta-lactamase superfamily II)
MILVFVRSGYLMRIIRINTVYQLTFMPRLFPVNCYFVEEAKGLTLIDAALPYSAKGILQAAKQIGKPITNLVLTHAHEDHIGALDGLKMMLPDLRIHISKRDSRLMTGDVSLDPYEPDTPIRGSVPKKLKTRADVLLHEGDRIGSLLAIETPGHTPGSMSFLDTRNQSLIVGDAFQTRGGIAVSGQTRFWFPFPAMATWDKATSLESAHKLLKLNPSLLAVGHGRMLPLPAGPMKDAITTAEHHLKQIHQQRGTV